MTQLKFGVIPFPSMFDVKDDGSEDLRCRFSESHFGRYFNWLIDYVGNERSRINCTTKNYDIVGSLDESTRNYSGIIGGVQSGEVDVSIMPFYYPLEGDEESFEYSPPVFEDTMTMMSVYYTNDKEESTDLLFMFDPIPTSLWIGLLFTFLVLVRLLDLGNKILRKKNQLSSWWLVFRAYLNDDNFIWDSPFYVIYAFFASTTIFFAMGFMMNSASTDLVVIDTPKVFNSYEQILSRDDVKVGLTPIAPEYMKFSTAPEGSFHRKLFSKAHFYYSMNDIAAIGPLFAARELVFVNRELGLRAGGLFFIAMFEKGAPKLRALLAIDPNAERYSNVFAWNKKSPEIIKNKMAECIYKLVESGLMKFGFTQAPEIIADSFMMAGISLTPTVKRKLSYEVELTETSYQIVKLSNMKYFLILIVCCSLFSLIVLLTEFEANEEYKHIKHLKNFILKLSSLKLSLRKFAIKFRKSKVSPAPIEDVKSSRNLSMKSKSVAMTK